MGIRHGELHFRGHGFLHCQHERCPVLPAGHGQIRIQDSQARAVLLKRIQPDMYPRLVHPGMVHAVDAWQFQRPDDGPFGEGKTDGMAATLRFTDLSGAFEQRLPRRLVRLHVPERQRFSRISFRGGESQHAYVLIIPPVLI